MLMPRLFNENLFQNFFDFPFADFGSYQEAGLMSTDVKEGNQGYEVTMNLPGVQKEDVKAELQDGYLTIHANSNKEETDSSGRYIRKERYSGSCSRSFYVGDQITEEDIKARFENGTLKLLIPKKEAAPQVEDTHRIAIEG